MAPRGSLFLLVALTLSATASVVSAESLGSQVGDTLRKGAEKAQAFASEAWASAQPHTEQLLEKGAHLATQGLEVAKVVLASATRAVDEQPQLAHARDLLAGWVQSALAALNDFFVAIGSPSPLEWLHTAWSSALHWVQRSPPLHSLAVALLALYLAHALGGSGKSAKQAKPARRAPPPQLERVKQSLLDLADRNARAAEALGKLSGAASSLKTVLATLPAGAGADAEAAKEASQLKAQARKVVESIRADLSVLDVALGRVAAVCA